MDSFVWSKYAEIIKLVFVHVVGRHEKIFHRYWITTNWYPGTIVALTTHARFEGVVDVYFTNQKIAFALGYANPPTFLGPWW